MKLAQQFFKTNPEYGPFILRLFLAGVMFPHGAQKALGWFGGYGLAGTMKFFTETMQIPAPFAALAIAAEFLGPIALALGLFSRLSALGIGAVITVAAVMVNLQHGFFMNWYGTQKGEGFEYHLLMAGMATAVVLQGGGKWALDSIIHRKLQSRQEAKPEGGKAQWAPATV